MRPLLRELNPRKLVLDPGQDRCVPSQGLVDSTWKLLYKEWTNLRCITTVGRLVSYRGTVDARLASSDIWHRLRLVWDFSGIRSDLAIARQRLVSLQSWMSDMVFDEQCRGPFKLEFLVSGEQERAEAQSRGDAALVTFGSENIEFKVSVVCETLLFLPPPEQRL